LKNIQAMKYCIKRKEKTQNKNSPSCLKKKCKNFKCIFLSQRHSYENDIYCGLQTYNPLEKTKPQKPWKDQWLPVV
jgi:hypothetical protein